MREYNNNNLLGTLLRSGIKSSRTRSIGLVQSKGGAGRSTLATNLAGELSKLGTVALIDCDQPQATSSSWASLRKAMNPNVPLHTFQAHTARDLVSLAAQLTDRVDWLVFDGPSRIVGMTRAILSLADLALVPLSASMSEVWATSDLLPHISDALKFRGGSLKVRIVWTRLRTHVNGG